MKKLYVIISLILLVSLLIFPTQSIDGAHNGISRCLYIIIPSLLPFFICSKLLINLGLINILSRYTGFIMRPLFNVPGSGSFAFCLGIISGYPVGAKSAVTIYEQGLCTKTEAERLTAFCNNSGPLFIIGAVGVGLYNSAHIGYVLYISHILSALVTGFFFRFYKKDLNQKKHRRSTVFSVSATSLGAALSDAVKDSVISIAMVCGYIIGFSVVIAILQQSGLISLAAALLTQLGMDAAGASGFIMGLFEITNGIGILSAAPALLPFTSLLIAWSGISVLLQVAGIISKHNFSVKALVLAKIIQGITAFIITALY